MNDRMSYLQSRRNREALAATVPDYIAVDPRDGRPRQYDRFQVRGHFRDRGDIPYFNDLSQEYRHNEAPPPSGWRPHPRDSISMSGGGGRRVGPPPRQQQQGYYDEDIEQYRVPGGAAMPAPPVTAPMIRYPPQQRQQQQPVYYEQPVQQQPQVIYVQQPVQQQPQLRQPQAYYQQQQQQQPQVVYVQQQPAPPPQAMMRQQQLPVPVPRMAAPPPASMRAMPNPNRPLKPSDRFRMRLAQEDPNAYARKKLGGDLKVDDNMIHAPPPAHVLQAIDEDEEFERKRQRMMKGASTKHDLKHEAKDRQQEFLESKDKYMDLNKRREKQHYKDLFGISMQNLLDADKQVRNDCAIH
jgi:hypothetical protein